MPKPSLTTIVGVVAGAAFTAFPLIRPWADKSTDPTAAAAAFAAPEWVISHSAGMLGWICLAAAVATLAHRSRAARTAAWLVGLGAAAILPYYGGETFALHALATSHGLGAEQVAAAAAEFRNGLVQSTIFALGFALTTAGAVVLAVDERRRSRRWSTWAIAGLVALYLPQFFLPNGVRIAHGIALGLALAWWATRDHDGRTAVQSRGQEADERSHRAAPKTQAPAGSRG